MEPRLYTTQEVADEVGCSSHYVGTLITQGKIEAVRYGRRGYRLEEAEIAKVEAYYETSLPRRLPLSNPTEEGDEPLSDVERQLLEKLVKLDEPLRAANELRTLRRRFKRPDGDLETLRTLDLIRRDRVQLKTLSLRYPHVKAEDKR